MKKLILIATILMLVTLNSYARPNQRNCNMNASEWQRKSAHRKALNPNRYHEVRGFNVKHSKPKTHKRSSGSGW